MRPIVFSQVVFSHKGYTDIFYITALPDIATSVLYKAGLLPTFPGNQPSIRCTKPLTNPERFARNTGWVAEDLRFCRVKISMSSLSK